MSKPKTTRLSIELNAQPKQYHALHVTVESVRELEEGDLEVDVLRVMGPELSKALEERIIAEITKFYGAAACASALAGYFNQSPKA